MSVKSRIIIEWAQHIAQKNWKLEQYVVLTGYKIRLLTPQYCDTNGVKHRKLGRDKHESLQGSGK